MAKQPHLSPLPLSVTEQAAEALPASRISAAVITQVATLRWAVGMFCAAVGALMLVVPHQFSSQSFSFIRPQLFWVGIIYLLSGVALLIATAVGQSGRLRALAHLACAAVLAFYAYALLRTATLSGGPLYLTLAVGTLAAGLVPPSAEPSPIARRRDLFAFLMGFCGVSLGVVMLIAPEQFRSSIYDLIRPALRWFGLAYILGGVSLMLVHVRPPRSLLLFWLPHLVIGAIFLYYMVLVSVPNRGITGIMFYGGFGLLLILQPLIGPAIARFDASLLRVRLGLFFLTAAAIPLTVTVAMLSAQQERVAVDQILLSRRLLAVSVARGIDDLVEPHLSAVRALASEPALLAPAPESQRAVLERFSESYAQFAACTRYDASGLAVARSDSGTLGAPVDPARFAAARRAGQPLIELQPSPAGGAAVLALGAPVAGPDESQAGGVVCELEPRRLAALLQELDAVGDRRAYLVDGQGRVVIASRPDLPVRADLSSSPVVQAALGGGGSGSLRYGEPPTEQLAGYAPVAALGWGAVVERPVADDLRSVRASRELAFGILLLAITFAAIAGVAVASYLTRPLNALALAVSRFAAGDAAAPLPQEGLSEVDRVSAAFDRMRRELSAAAAGREQAIAQRDTFFSVAAHELKTPLTALLGQAQLVQRRGAREGDLSDKNRRSIDVVVAQAQRLDALITDLLDISRLQQGRLSLQRAPLDLGALVARVVEEIQPMAELHTLRCEILAAPDDLTIDGDALRLEQVLHNLISNAIKYSPQGGEVLVCLDRAPHAVRVAVSDHGIGVPAESLPHLFERFYRAPNADPRQISGMGVGLFVVREIVTLHGGHVAVTSVEGEGSTFTVVLPAGA